MERALQTEIYNDKMTLFDRKLPYAKLSIKQKSSKRSNRASKSVRKYFIEKESGWNDSFVFDRIPTHIEPININVKRLYRKKSEMSNILSISQTTRNPTSEVRYKIHKMSTPHNNLYSVRSVPNHSRPSKVKPETSCTEIIKYLQESINKIYYLKQISKCHIGLMKRIKQGVSNEGDKIKLLKQELRDLKSPHSIIHQAKMVCQSRQTLLAAVRNIVQMVKVNPIHKSNKTKNLPDMLRQLRNHSLNCIQKIFRWRQLLVKFQQFSEKKFSNIIYCLDETGQNYLLKILEDSEFIHKSGLFPHSSFPDPFFLSYEDQFVMEMKKYSKIRACQLFLLEESL